MLFQTLLRKANKILNHFFEEYVPQGREFLAIKKATHLERFKRYQRIMEETTSLQEGEALDGEKLGKTLTKLLEESIKDKYMSQGDAFDLYVVSDNDIVVDVMRLNEELIVVLKRIKDFIKNADEEVLLEILQLERLLLKVIVAFKMIFDNLAMLDNHKMECYQSIYP